MVICAVIADCDVWEDIADYCRVKETWFREALGMELKNGIPSHDTMQRIFEMLDPKEFEKCFAEWVSSVCTKKDRQVISVDGKTVCGSRSADRNPSHGDFFDESQKLSDSIVDALADLPLDNFSQPLKDQRAIKRQNPATITTTNDVFRNTSPAFPLIAELSATLIIPFSGCKRKVNPC